MHHTITFDVSLSCFIVTATGPATIADILSFVDEILRDGRWQNGVNAIVDYRLADLNVLSYPDANVLADSIRKLKREIGVCRIAHVVSRAVDFGMVRMWESMVEGQVSFDVRVFYSMDEARRWTVRSTQQA